jgi:hypothetical protein
MPGPAPRSHLYCLGAPELRVVREARTPHGDPRYDGFRSIDSLQARSGALLRSPAARRSHPRTPERRYQSPIGNRELTFAFCFAHPTHVPTGYRRAAAVAFGAPVGPKPNSQRAPGPARSAHVLGRRQWNRAMKGCVMKMTCLPLCHCAWRQRRSKTRPRAETISPRQFERKVRGHTIGRRVRMSSTGLPEVPGRQISKALRDGTRAEVVPQKR